MGKLGVVIVAAGKGSRMRSVESKQFLQVGDKPILVHTLELFQRIGAIDFIVLVTGPDDVARCRQYAVRYHISKLHSIVVGGAERQHSVREGLKALPPEVEHVLVHDGVRPFANTKDIIHCWSKAVETGAAVLAVPVKDTIKIVDETGVIRSTPDRRSLWAIQTPQAFRRSLLEQAYEQAERDGFVGTDDAMLVERFGTPVHVVQSDYYNIKITTPEDLPWAEWIAQNVRGED
ncbi:2-C-methyl-D-erythritol 4-phosphate cytidylyltransferase [Paenibacillus thalictri]|uniref:2-C-methyl-D-erythritol 4-phosphate cytidylyltransferase n=1 Tax=Paenibacillus thalictri TaxID=2527873 RepID=A0A4Q9DFM7_9BACL|nr:2-C-methyl-D-erythritol 4-phosphate cytidylyltransferase [Paenibacillus thalictri]TBL69164.1 2-C-methyl-D-erythritol 4-phosphate cytidylyltransferase [Paenibacillus thalictri]